MSVKYYGDRSRGNCKINVNFKLQIFFFLYLYRYIILLLKFQIGQGFGMVHFTKCSPTQSIVRKAMLAMQDSMPLRLHRVHFLHAPAFIESILNIFYPLLKVRLVQKVSAI